MLKKFTLLLLSGVLLIVAATTLLNRSREPRAMQAAGGSDTVEISPAAAYATSTLEARRTGVSGAAGAVTSCRWFKNGSEIAGQTANTLAPEHFKKGDLIEAEVSLDGQGPVRAPALTIQNSAPRVLSAAAELRTEPSATIYVEVSAVDPDGDALTQKFVWYRNENEIKGETGPTLDVSGLRAGDNVYARVSAGDGVDWSSPEKSDPIRIGSNAPSITSVPPQRLEAGSRFVYQVKTTAPGAVDFELDGAPAGMTITGSGLIEWVVPNETAQYSVVVRVSDETGGEATQKVNIAAEKLEEAADSTFQR